MHVQFSKHIVHLLWARDCMDAKNYISNIDNINSNNNRLAFIKCLL